MSPMCGRQCKVGPTSSPHGSSSWTPPSLWLLHSVKEILSGDDGIGTNH
jgi:hypothetical protein